MAGQTAGIVAALIGRIEAGTIAPGDLLDEQALAREFGVSRTPVREALLQLDALGLVRRRNRGGAEVFRPTLEEFLAIHEVQAGLEGRAAGLAARRLSAADALAITAASEACAAHLAAAGEAAHAAYYALNLEFHRAVAAAARNAALLDLVRMNARRLLAYYRARHATPGAITRSVAEHRAIAAAILDRDGPRAEALMAGHVGFDSATAMDLVAAMEGGG